MRYSEKGLLKAGEKCHSSFQLEHSPFLLALIRKPKRPGTNDHALFVLQKLSKNILCSKMHHQTKFGLLTISSFWIIHKNVFANLCIPIDDVIIIPVYEFNFKPEKVGERRAGT